MDGESLLVSDPCSTRGCFQGGMTSANSADLDRSRRNTSAPAEVR